MEWVSLGIGALIALASGIYGKYQSDEANGQLEKQQRRAEKRQEELLKAKGPQATQGKETYDGLSGRRSEMFKKGLMSTIKTSNFGLLNTATSGTGKTKLGQ